MRTVIVCARCKAHVNQGRNVLLRPGAKKQHIVCLSCYERVKDGNGRPTKQK